jgi:hypothetical protein
MAWAWNDSITASNWNTIGVQRAFMRALSERYRACNLSDSVALPDPQVGDPVIGVRGFQLAILLMIAIGTAERGQFIKSAPSGEDLTGCAWADAAEFFADAGLNPAGFTRKYPRELLDLTRGTYTDGSPVAAGHVARCLADGKTYVHQGGSSAPWSPSGNPPDVLTAYGFAEAGDYRGTWHYNEIRACFNLMTRTLEPVVAPVTVGYLADATNGSGDPSLDIAKANCQADWAPNAASIAGIQSYTRISTYWHSLNPNVIGYYGRAGGQWGTFKVAAHATTLQASRTLYARGDWPLFASDAGFDNATFDNFGLPITQNSWDVYSAHDIGTDVLGAAGVVGFPPAWPTAPAEADQDRVRGFVADLMVYMDWAVAGGFQYY